MDIYIMPLKGQTESKALSAYMMLNLIMNENIA